MSIGTVDGIFTITLDAFASLGLCAIIALLSFKFAKRVKFINKFCIPPVVVGGLLYSIIYSVLTATGLVNIVADTSLNDTLFILFFTSIGMTTLIDGKLMKTAGKVFVILFLFEGFGSFAQNVLALTGGHITGLPYPVAFLSGTPTMYGGIPGGASWGAKVEALGFVGATGIGIASGAIGQIMGGCISAPVVKKLFIDRHKLHSTEELIKQSGQAAVTEAVIASKTEFSLERMLKQIAILGVLIPIGMVLRTWFMNLTNFYILDFVGCMVLAIIVVNINQKVKLLDIDQQFMQNFGSVVLNIFLTMSFLTLNLADLKDLIGPTLLICLAQGVFIVLFSMIIFRVLGKTYEAAVLCAGFMGHGLGNMTTAFASMDTVTDEYGPCKIAYIITPLIGACLIDLFDVPIVAWAYNTALNLAGLG